MYSHHLPTLLSGYLRTSLTALPSLAPALSSLPAQALTISPCASGSVAGYDYQSNICLSLGRAASQSPASVASQLLAPLRGALSPLAHVDVGSSGFMNFRLRDGWLRGCLAEAAPAACSSSASGAQCLTLVDYASPNVGKELHVGHLRSAVIGDVLARVLEFAGQGPVARVSHVGDCGLPVALVIAQLLQEHSGSGAAAAAAQQLSPAGLSRVYVQAKQSAEKDRAFAAQAASVLQALQAELASQAPTQPPSDIALTWRAVCAASRAGYEPLFERLQVSGLVERGESTYLPSIPSVLAQLVADGAAVEDGGALVMHLGSASSGSGSSSTSTSTSTSTSGSTPPAMPPLLLRKADGAWLYATSDMAALHSRLRQGLQRIVYVTDAAQALHFRQLFAAAARAGWVDASSSPPTNTLHPARPPIHLHHAAFGVVTGGAGGKKLSSREGVDITSLASLLDSAAEFALGEMRAGGEGEGGGSSASAGASALPAAAERVGASAVRFFDLCHRRDSSYAFSLQRAFSLKGHSASYAFYACARLRGLREKAALELGLPRGSGWEGIRGRLGEAGAAAAAAAAAAQAGPLPSEFAYSSPQERELALAIVASREAVASAERSLMPHHLTDHILRLAQAFHAFYTTSRVLPPLAATLGAGGAEGRVSHWSAAELQTAGDRVDLCRATDAALRLCLDLCGMYHVERL